MVVRRQTWLLLLVLVAVGLLALVYSASRHARAERSGILTYRPASSDELKAAFGAIRTPHGFRRSDDCWLPAEPGGFCEARWPSLPPTPALLKRLVREAGFSLTAAPSEYDKPVVCLHGRREGLTIATCSRVAMLQGQLFSISADAAVVERNDVPQGTSATVGHPNHPHGHLRGIQLHFLDAGFPDPEGPL